MNNKWINEGGVFFPISGNVVLHVSPGPGVFEVVQPGAPTDRRIGLNKLYDKFEFKGKVYQLGPDGLEDRIKLVWDSDYFRDNNKSVGLILNGLKGSGKTWLAKQIANDMDMPVLIIDNSFDGAILNFIRSLNFSCTILVDEAEKIFKLGDEDDILLRMIDNAGSNICRHLFILTTNTLDVNQNLIGRTGRIRYLVNFKNLPAKIVREVIDDNLDPTLEHLKPALIEKINLLEYNSIDLLKSIIEEVNISRTVDDPDSELMNIPLSKYCWDIYEIGRLDWESAQYVRKFIQSNNPNNMPLSDWINTSIDATKLVDVEGVDLNEVNTYEQLLEAKYPMLNFYREVLSSRVSVLWEGCETSQGTIIKEPDKSNGWFSWTDRYSGEETVGVILKQRNHRSLYSSGLVY